MGLIQQLKNRELTGCRGCDAIRMGLYKRIGFMEATSRVEA